MCEICSQEHKIAIKVKNSDLSVSTFMRTIHHYEVQYINMFHILLLSV